MLDNNRISSPQVYVRTALFHQIGTISVNTAAERANKRVRARVTVNDGAELGYGLKKD